MNSPAIIASVNKDFALTLPDTLTDDALRAQLAVHINELILYRFDHLVQLLYRMDVSEKKLKQLLQDHRGTDAGDLIAGLVLEREQQKINSRQQFRQSRNTDTDAEAW